MKTGLTILLLLPLLSFSQEFKDYIKENAIAVERNQKLSPKVYEAISSFELIMVGEMHGTQEPALFVAELANLIANEEGKAVVGLEIPEKQMTLFLEDPTKENLEKSAFFTKANLDGRNGQAWFDLILKCSENPKIELFYFDNVESGKGQNRDSVMYEEVKKIKLKFEDNKLITLTGNVHNKRVPYRDVSTLGVYCVQDSVHFGYDKVCSIDHGFTEGTMLNNVGNGLELTQIPFEANMYSEAVDFENYLVFYSFAKTNPYNCLYYTQKVTHSKELKE